MPTMHPVISILLTAWFGLGSALGPHFMCACVDGKVTIEIGQRFCCDTEDSCGGAQPFVGESCDSGVDAWTCADGCQSTLLFRGFIGTLDDDTRSHLSTRSYSTDAHYTTFATGRFPVTTRVRCGARAPNSRITKIHQLRTVILLV